jgi:hypothetical protein
MNKLKDKFWKYLKAVSAEKVQASYLKIHGCDSCCTRCNVWESDGNKIYTEPSPDGTDLRTCTNCGYKWHAIFTPAGFIEINES